MDLPGAPEQTLLLDAKRVGDECKSGLVTRKARPVTDLLKRVSLKMSIDPKDYY